MSKPTAIHFHPTRNTPKSLNESIRLTVMDDRITIRTDFCAQEVSLIEDSLREALRSVIELRKMYDNIDARRARR